MNKYKRVHSYVFKFSQLPRWSVCMENQLLVRQRKKVHSGFAVKNLVMDLFVQRMKAMPFKELSNSRFVTYTVDLRNFVLSKTYRKKAMEDLILRVQTAKIHVLSGCGLTRIKSRNQTVITDSKQR